MRISIDANESIEELEISIKCTRITQDIEKIISMIRMLDMKLTVQKKGEIFIIDIDKVLYIDTVDRKTFIYTSKDVYESDLRLYELEAQLLQAGFFRANKSSIINFRQIVSLKTELDRRILVTMSNGEKLIVSRQYAGYVKQKLEGK